MESPDRRFGPRRQYAAYVALSLLVVILAVVLLSLAGGATFDRFFGERNPILVIGVASGAGVAALWALQFGYGFAVLEGGKTLRGVALSARELAQSLDTTRLLSVLGGASGPAPSPR